MSLSAQLRQPIRYPNTASPEFMQKRARWLVVLGFLLPGTAQLLTGHKRLGRFGFRTTLLLLCGGGAALVWLLVARAAALTFFTNTIVLLVLQLVLYGYALLWLFLGLHTIKLLQPRRLRGGWRAVMVFVALLLTALQVFAAAWTATTIGAGRSLISTLFRNSMAAVKPVDGRYNILLLGADAGADREGMRPDSISLVSIDANTGQSVIIGLPRELANVPFPENSPMYAQHPEGFGVTDGCYTGRCWLNSLYSEVEIFQPELYPDATSRASSPGIEATKDAVSGATGLTVQFFVLINMDGFEKLIDALGGVKINVREEIPIGGNAQGYGVEGYIEPGERQLNGYEALWYARSRYGSALGDYDRMARQRDLQAAILAQMTPQNVLLRFQEVAASGEYLTETDIPSAMLGYFADLAVKAKQHEPVRVELVPPEVITEDPDYSVVQQLVRDGVRQASPEGEQ